MEDISASDECIFAMSITSWLCHVCSCLQLPFYLMDKKHERTRQRMIGVFFLSRGGGSDINGIEWEHWYLKTFFWRFRWYSQRICIVFLFRVLNSKDKGSTLVRKPLPQVETTREDNFYSPSENYMILKCT